MLKTLEPQVRNVTVLFTNRCNISCEHCYVSSHPGGDFGISPATVKDIIDETSRLPGDPLFSLSGGEPLSRKKDCLEILEYASGKVRTQLLTNAILITPEIASRLAALDISIRISLDGVTAEENDAIRGKGSYEKINRGIGCLLSAGFPVSRLSICSTLVDPQPEAIQHYLNWCEEKNIGYMRFHALCRLGRGASLAENSYGAETAEDRLEKKKDFLYSFAQPGSGKWVFTSLDKEAPVFNEINIYSNGAVYPYVVSNHLSPHPHEIAAGNIETQSLGEILRSEKMAESILLKFMALNKGSRSLSRAFLASRTRQTAAVEE